VPNRSPKTYGPMPPDRVVVPLMRQRWEMLTFLHWGYPPDVIQQNVPARLSVETRDELAWVGLVAFSMRLSPPLGRAAWGTKSFAETNLRTYVVGPDGRSGVFFFSLDAANRVAVVAARLALGLPYFAANMDIDRSPRTVTYSSFRSQGTGRGAGHHLNVEPGHPIPSGDLSEFDHFLTARFALYNCRGRLTFRTPVEHPPWRLRRAQLLGLEQGLIEAAGLRAPSGPPIVHYSDGVDSRIGIPRVVG
jgi:uncharacterized protein YqjF (DUF2071 family)